MFLVNVIEFSLIQVIKSILRESKQVFFPRVKALQSSQWRFDMTF